MFSLAFKIWFTAHLIFLAGLGIYCGFNNSLGPEAIIAGFLTLFIGMACSAPAFFILGWLLKLILRRTDNSPQAMLAAAFAAALSALITYTGWWGFLNIPDMAAVNFKEGLDFLLCVIGCTTIATFIQYRSFRQFNPPLHRSE